MLISDPEGTAASGKGRWRLWFRRLGILALAFVLLGTLLSFVYNLATDTHPKRPANLRMIDAGGIVTRYRTWGSSGSPIVLVPGAFETADTYSALGPVLGRDHRVFALDLTGTGYSQLSGPFNATHLADQVLGFTKALQLTGVDSPVLIGHSSGAAVVGMAALRDPAAVAGLMFLDGDATPLKAPGIVGSLAINPFRTTALRLALRSDWLIRAVYSSQCGPTCPKLTSAGVNVWRYPLQQPGFGSELSYVLHHGIPSMTGAELRQLKKLEVPKHVVFGADDSQYSSDTAASVATRIGAPSADIIPGRHLTMIASPNQVADAVRALLRAAGR